ncbi:hypothetical protein HDV05_006066, partial [Chytridiales sp. JEL 0842]
SVPRTTAPGSKTKCKPKTTAAGGQVPLPRTTAPAAADGGVSVPRTTAPSGYEGGDQMTRTGVAGPVATSTAGTPGGRLNGTIVVSAGWGGRERVGGLGGQLQAARKDAVVAEKRVKVERKNVEVERKNVEVVEKKVELLNFKYLDACDKLGKLSGRVIIGNLENLGQIPPRLAPIKITTNLALLITRVCRQFLASFVDGVCQEPMLICCTSVKITMLFMQYLKSIAPHPERVHAIWSQVQEENWNASFMSDPNALSSQADVLVMTHCAPAGLSIERHYVRQVYVFTSGMLTSRLEMQFGSRLRRNAQNSHYPIEAYIEAKPRGGLIAHQDMIKSTLPATVFNDPIATQQVTTFIQHKAEMNDTINNHVQRWIDVYKAHGVPYEFVTGEPDDDIVEAFKKPILSDPKIKTIRKYFLKDLNIDDLMDDDAVTRLLATDSRNTREDFLQRSRNYAPNHLATFVFAEALKAIFDDTAQLPLSTNVSRLLTAVYDYAALLDYCLSKYDPMQVELEDPAQFWRARSSNRHSISSKRAANRTQLWGELLARAGILNDGNIHGRLERPHDISPLDHFLEQNDKAFADVHGKTFAHWRRTGCTKKEGEFVPHNAWDLIRDSILKSHFHFRLTRKRRRDGYAIVIEESPVQWYWTLLRILYEPSRIQQWEKLPGHAADIHERNIFWDKVNADAAAAAAAADDDDVDDDNRNQDNSDNEMDYAPPRHRPPAPAPAPAPPPPPAAWDPNADSSDDEVPLIRRRPSDRDSLMHECQHPLDQGTYNTDLHTVILVTCYTEGEASLRKTLESLASTEYHDEKKLLFIVADGLVTGKGNEKSTPEILIDMIELDDMLGRDPEAYSYVAVASGSKAHNMAKVYCGHFVYKFRRVPAILVIKCGTPAESLDAKPGNRGKRDSQVILMNFFSRTTLHERLTPLDWDLSRKIHHITYYTPHFYEFVLMVDADTTVEPSSLRLMVNCMYNDPQVMGICGETEIANKFESWVSMIQVFQYYISHNMGKAFESVFGGVTCLPGCFCMYRLKALGTKTLRPSKNLMDEKVMLSSKSGATLAETGRVAGKEVLREWVPLLANPEVVSGYATSDVSTLHRKNLILLGEDRYLAAWMLRLFPRRKMLFLPQALASTVVPADFKTLLSQRRRWINSSVHNLMELVLIQNRCGSFCFSMQFVVLLDLISTIILPVSLALTYYLIYLTSTNTVNSGVTTSWANTVTLLSVTFLPAVFVLFSARKLTMVLWMLVHILALPVWQFILPLYSFWNFDDFSWGATRQVDGQKESKGGHLEDNDGKEEEEAVKMVLFKKWEEYESAWRKSIIRRSTMETTLVVPSERATVLATDYEMVVETEL